MKPILSFIFVLTLIFIQKDLSAQNKIQPVKYSIVLIDQVPYLVQMDSKGSIVQALSNVSELYKTKASVEEIITIELFRLSNDTNALAGISVPYALTSLPRNATVSVKPQN